MRVQELSLLRPLRRLVNDNLPDDADIYDPTENRGSGGDPFVTYPATPSRRVKCRVQEVPRVPNTPGVGGSAMTTANYDIKLPFGTLVSQKARIVVNGRRAYQVQVVPDDKSDAITIAVRCFQIGGVVGV